jgi:hypothetical protein
MDEKPLRLVWGGRNIGRVIGLDEQQTHYLLAAGLIRSAHKKGKRWVADEGDLQREFSGGPPPTSRAES